MATVRRAATDKSPATSYRLTDISSELYQAYVFETIGATLSLILYGEHIILVGDVLMHELASGITTSLFYSCIKSLISSLKRGGTSIGICPKQLRLVYLCLIFMVVTVWTVCSTWTLVYLRIEYPLYPGGPVGWELEHYNHPVMNLGNSAFIMTTWFSDGFMASPRFSTGVDL